MRALLDVNLLIALLDSDHVHHGRAWRWLDRNIGFGWASCPLTQNGCVRIMSQPGYPNPLPAASVIDRLAQATGNSSHEFWPDEISLLDRSLFDHRRIHGPRQLTDLYLLGLSVRHGARLASFDDSIPIAAVRGATDANLVVP